ncbi:MAG: Gfo/Idh/MocA family oxidoreductase [Eubacteriales bacterium]|nr:Gfo/Idh/MocA family oxidoreductase [Eubacteriales bacterium]
MIRIGIFGAENSHAMAFSRIFNGGDPRYADLQVVAIGGEEEEACRAVMRECGVEMYAARPEDMLGHVDAVMITSRDGALHAKYAAPFVDRGMPVFVDKPFTRDVAQAEALVALAEEKGARIMGGSSVKLVEGAQRLSAAAKDKANGRRIGGSLWAPVSMHNAYGDFWFYAAHLVELCLKIFGMPQSVQAFRSGDDVTCIARYADCDVALHFTEGAYHYGGTVLMEKSALTMPIDISECYALEAEQYARLVRTGEMPETGEQLIEPVRVMAAIVRSLESGAMERV